VKSCCRPAPHGPLRDLLKDDVRFYDQVLEAALSTSDTDLSPRIHAGFHGSLAGASTQSESLATSSICPAVSGRAWRECPSFEVIVGLHRIGNLMHYVPFENGIG
jgi:hypothetical protein